MALLLIFLPMAGTTTSPVSASTQIEEIRDVTVTRDVVYKRVDGVDLALDVYRPPGGPHPALILIHGGGWVAGSKDGSTSTGVLLAESGFVTFIIDYRLAPPGGRWRAPAQIEDSRAAVKWVRAYAHDYGALPESVGALGFSAGAYLALMLATTGTEGEGKADAVASMSGPVDLSAVENSTDQEEIDIVVNYTGCTVEQCPDLFEELSPISHVDESDSPIFLANSTEELTPVEQATSMEEALREAGVPHELELVSGSTHGRRLARAVAPQAIGFLKTHLEDATTPPGGSDGPSGGPLPWILVVLIAGTGLGLGVLAFRRSS